MKKLFFVLFIVLSGLVIAADSPYARRIRPVSAFGACIENEVAYDMVLHKPGICTNTGYKDIMITGGSGFEVPLTFSSPLVRTVNTISCPTCGVTGTSLAQFASTTSAQLRTLLSDENGTGVALFNSSTSATFITPIINVTSDATGDIYYRNAGGLFTRLGIGSDDQVLQVIGGIPSWQTISSGSGITNTAGAGIIPVSDGTNLIAGSFLDDSIGNISVGTGVPLIFTSDTSISNATLLWSAGTSTSNRTRLDLDSENKFIKAQVGLDEASYFGVGSTGTEFKINILGKISFYSGAAPTDGQVLVGNTAGGYFDAAVLNADTGISILNGAGSITIGLANNFFKSGTPGVTGNGSIVGGSVDSAGKVTSTITGAATITVTFSIAFVNGSSCSANNGTTANIVRSSSTASVLTINGVTVTDDVISYQCLGY